MPGILTGPGIGSINDQAEESQFANDIAHKFGLDPRVVKAWAQLETGGHALDHNWLNLRPYPGDPYTSVSSGGFEEFATLSAAEQATERRIGQPFASAIRSSAGQSPQQEIAAIASTGWDAGHYGGAGGPNLMAEFRSLFPGSDPGGFSKEPTSPAGGTAPGGGPFGVLDPIEGAIGSITDAFKFIFSLRFLEILGGGALILLGLYLLGKQFGATFPAPGPVAKAAGGITAAAPQAASTEPDAAPEETPVAHRETARPVIELPPERRVRSA